MNKNSQRKEEIGMSKRVALCSAALVLVCAAGVANVRAEHRGRTLVVTMTNDPIENQINVYDADTHTLLQSLSTHGKGGVGGNARGVRQHDGELVRRSTTDPIPLPCSGATATA